MTDVEQVVLWFIQFLHTNGISDDLIIEMEARINEDLIIIDDLAPANFISAELLRLILRVAKDNKYL